MTFITFSLFLGGLAATAVPVLLHLLMRGKPKQIEFPSLMFLKKRLETYRRNDRLKNLVLLAMRVFALILFGLALARPTIKLADWFPTLVVSAKNEPGTKRNFVSSLAASLGSQDAPIAAAVVIDTSPRMEYITENQSRLDVAKEFSHWILSQLPQGSAIAVLSSEREAPVFQVDRLAAEEKVNRLQVMPQGKPVIETVRDALTLLAGSEFQQRELYVVTDLSEPGWPGSFGDSVKNMIDGMKSGGTLFGGSDKELGLFIVDISADMPVNSSIVQLTLLPEIVSARSPVRIDMELAHTGPAATKTVELLLTGVNPSAPNEQTVRSSKMVDFPEGDSRKNISFTISGFEPGTHQGKLRFAVSDALPIDDQGWFTVEVQTPWKILVLAQQPVRDSSLFLRKSLEVLESAPFEVATAPLSDLPGMTMKELGQYGAVMLLDPSDLDPAVWKKLADYASAGHGVGIVFGGRAELAKMNDPAAVELLGARLVRQARDPDGDTWIVPGHGISPIFSPFRQIQPLDRFPWDALPVFRYWELSELSDRTDVAAPFSDGRPAIVTHPMGRGRVVVMATPVSELVDTDQPWNLLTRSEARWVFLLLSEGIAKFLVGAEEQRYNFLAGESVVLRPNLETFPSTCLLGTPSGNSIRLTPDVARREIGVSSAVEPGNYRIRSGGARESLDTGFSVNISGESTNLQKIDRSRLDGLLGENNYRLARTPQEIEIGIARRRIGQEIFAMLLVILTVLFVAEYVFSNRFYGGMKDSS